MLSTLLQIYARNSSEAVELYRAAFDCRFGNDWRNPDGSCAHTELIIDGQILAVSEAPEHTVFGNNMQFCLRFDDATLVDQAWHALHPQANIIHAPARCPFSERMFALVDRFGVHWCIFC